MAKVGNQVAEKYLLDSMNRIARNPQGYSVLYVSVSKLKPKNRHPSFVKIFAKMFDDLVGATNGMMFILSNSDFAILGKNISPETVDLAVDKLRHSLPNDPMLYNQDASTFASLFVFPEDFPALYGKIKALMESKDDGFDIEFLRKPLEAGQVDDVLSRLDNIDIPDIVKRQSVIQVGGAKKFEVLFQEFFVAVKDLSMFFDLNLDLQANKWLFMYLSQTLDKKTLASFEKAEITNWTPKISVNMNLSSIFSKEFAHLVDNFLKPDQKIIAEVQVMDVFNNLPQYFEAKELLNSQGHQILLDALEPDMICMLNLKRLNPDYMKIFWNHTMENAPDNPQLKELIHETGSDKFILAKCLDDKAMSWALKYKITKFQGPFADNIETALIKNMCPHGQKCKLMDCLKRRRMIAGDFRNKCFDKSFLDKILG